MTLRMGDGPVANLPPGLDAYAGYVNNSGIGQTWTAVKAIPAKWHLTITTNGSAADCADVESGAMISWTGYEVGYANASSVGRLIQTYGRPNKLWVAHYTNVPHICTSKVCWPSSPTIWQADGTQWTDHGGVWDESLLADNFFDFQNPPPAPSPAPQPKETEEMPLYVYATAASSDGSVPLNNQYVIDGNTRYQVIDPAPFIAKYGNPLPLPGDQIAKAS